MCTPTLVPQTHPCQASSILPRSSQRARKTPSQNFLQEPPSEGHSPCGPGVRPSPHPCHHPFIPLIPGEEERSWAGGDAGTPQLLYLFLLDAFNALTPLLGLLFEAPAFLEGGDPVLQLLLLVLPHLALELIGIL